MPLNLFPIGVKFDGPFEEPDELSDKSGVFIVAEKNEEQQWKIVYVGKSKEVKSLVSVHEKKAEWTESQDREVGYFAHYSKSEDTKQNIVERVKNRYRPSLNDD